MIAWMEGELLLRVVLLVPQNNQKQSKQSNLTLQSATRRSFWDMKPTGRSLWDGGSTTREWGLLSSVLDIKSFK